MNPGDKLLYQGNYISVILSPNGYERAHDRTGQVVGLLPFVVRPDGEVFFLTRWEPRSAWGSDPREKFMSSITGGIEEGEEPWEAAVREFHEEVGTEITREDLLYLGDIFGAKCLDTRYHLFAVDITEIGFQENGETDGSKGEALAHNELMDFETLVEDGADALLMVMVAKFQLMCRKLDLDMVDESDLISVTEGTESTSVVEEPHLSTEWTDLPDEEYIGTLDGPWFITKDKRRKVQMTFSLRSLVPVPVVVRFVGGWAVEYEILD